MVHGSTEERFFAALRLTGVFILPAAIIPSIANPQSAVEKKQSWKPVQFAIVRFNDDAPKSWNIYHGEKRGVLLVRLWKRYLLVEVKEQEVYEVDPDKVKGQGENVEWSPADVPDQSVDTSEWKVRDIGSMERIRFRFGKNGSFVDIQVPLQVNGKPMY
jgi:hypothetical protein